MFTIARTVANRPTLMHKLDPNKPLLSITLCGIQTQGWSRAYFRRSVPEILCKRCATVAEKDGIDLGDSPAV